MTDFFDDLAPCLEVLQMGGVILYPTDTVWGIGCDATNTYAVKKIFDLKKRPDARSMIILIAEAAELSQYAEAVVPRVLSFLKGSAGPTTVIYPGGKGLADNLYHSDGSIGIRIVNEPFCQALINAFHKPIVSTSANITGEPTPENFVQISKSVLNGVDYIVQFRQEDKTLAKPSTIVRLEQDGSVVIIRP
jgi:L-threonylcarbamoyladenylate synthase